MLYVDRVIIMIKDKRCMLNIILIFKIITCSMSFFHIFMNLKLMANDSRNKRVRWSFIRERIILSYG